MACIWFRFQVTGTSLVIGNTLRKIIIREFRTIFASLRQKRGEFRRCQRLPPVRLGGRAVEYYGMSTPKPLIDKGESRRIRVQIRHVLLEVWDPIGVKDEPHAQDEYDGYIGDIYEMLVKPGSDAELVEYLYWAVNENMGLGSAKRSDMMATAEALRRIPIPQVPE